MDIKQDSILSYTGQAWKYHVGALLGVVSTLVFITSFLLFTFSQWQFLFLIILAGAVALTGLIIKFTIRCPKCKSRWYLEALKKPLGSGSVIMVCKQNTCPVCGLSS